MSKYDGEDLLDSILSIMTTAGALNAKIAAIDAEKIAKGSPLTPSLAAIPDAGFYAQSWTDKVLNTSPGIFYGIEDVKATNAGPAVAKEYKCFIEVVLVDSGQSSDSWKRISRYSRALEELFSEAYAPAIASARVNVVEIRPMAFKLTLDSDDEIKVGGISLTVSLV